MARTRKLSRMHFASLLLALFLGVFAAQIAYSGTCEDGTGMPPFLGSEGVAPNIMLMIDNSASMYDLAYVEDVGQCTDESYDGSQTVILNESLEEVLVYNTPYAGYFEQYEWYTYNLTDNQFEAGKAAADVICIVADGTYKNNDVCVTMTTGTGGTPNEINAFAASGHFLNWAAASKMDIQKLVLTGGKYNPPDPVNAVDAQLIMESRGCVGKKMVKQVVLDNDADDANGRFKLTLGLTADNPKGGNTRLELYEIYKITSETEGNSEACQQAIDYLTFSEDVKLGTLKGYVDKCLGNPDNNTIEGHSNAAFNQGLHDCWFMASKDDPETPTIDEGLQAWLATQQGSVTRIKNACERIYNQLIDPDPDILGDEYWVYGLAPQDIEPGSSGYICRGDHRNNDGYVGRCWLNGPGPYPEPGTLYTSTSTSRSIESMQNNQALFAGENLGQNIESAGTTISGQTLINSQAAIEQVGFIEENRSALIAALQNFADDIGVKIIEKSAVARAFFDFIIAEAEAAVFEVTISLPTSDTGNWTPSNADNEESGKSVHSNNANDTATWQRAVPVSGKYMVSIWSACEAKPENRDPDAKYMVYGKDISDGAMVDDNGGPYTIDQATDCGKWVDLGERHFLTADPFSGNTLQAEVVVTAGGVQYTNADAVRLSLIEPDEPLPPECGDGIVDAEECDDVSDRPGDGCEEECDDGNEDPGDGCEPDDAEFPCTYTIIEGQPGAWNETNDDECVIQALLDFCGQVSTPDVIDPSDQTSLGGTGDYWNIPAILTDLSLSIQQGEPLLTMEGRIKWDSAEAPSGVIQKYAPEVRLGIMKFNELGDNTECKENSQEWGLFTNCSSSALTADGAVVNVPMDKWGWKDENEILVDPAKTIDFVVGRINEIEGTTWTPLAEAMYTATGYFGEKGCQERDDSGACLTDPDTLEEKDYRLNKSDYMVTPYAPIWEDNLDYAPGSIVMYNDKYWQTDAGGFSQDDPLTVDETGPSDDIGVTWAEKTVVTDAKGPWSTSTSYSEGDIVLKENKFYLAVSDTATGIDPDADTGANWVQISGPVEASCQSNNLIIITEGSSTADLNPKMLEFVTTHNDGEDADGTKDLEVPNPCDVLKGSTYFDDLTYYGQHATDMYEIEPFGGDDAKSTIQTHIVYTGASRTGLPGECDPEQFLKEAATNADPAGAPDALNKGEDEQKLRNSLEDLFRSILTRTSSGSAASVISASRGGEGALYQAIFWPAKDAQLPSTEEEPIFTEWTGEVHAFLVDSKGTLYLDSYPADGNGALDLPIDTNNDGSMDIRDQPVLVLFDESQEPQQTVGCPGTIERNDATDIDEIVFLDDSGACIASTRPLDEIEYLWSITDWLNSGAVDYNIEFNRAVTSSGFDFTGLNNRDKRYIFTWNDLNNDGVVDYSNSDSINEVRPFVDNLGSTTSTTGGLPDVDPLNNRGPIPLDFRVDPNESDAVTQVNDIINWVRGKNFNDPDNWRIRQVPGDITGDGKFKDTNGVPYEWVTWKLGDVVHSTPLSVSAPAENYHQLYRDYSYAEFLARWQKRRHMIYFGANDGMLHAVNGGFFNTILNPDPDDDLHLVEWQSRFCLTKDCQFDSGVEIGSTTAPVLGTEMWAYVPYNLIPHLKCLTKPGYEHKYYVDLRPRIFDVQIFEPEPACGTSDAPTPLEDGCIHPNGWGTILVGGMRFGGSKVQPCCLDEDDNGITDIPGYEYDNRELTSAYFILDITNPESPPTLLGEFTRTIDDSIDDDLNGDGEPDESEEVELGYTTVISTIIPMKVAPEEGNDKNCNNGDSEPGISKWYLVLGSGPTSLGGTSNQKGSLSIVPLDRLVGSSPKNMRIPKVSPVPTGDDAEFGSFTLSEGNSFISDMITVDIEIEKDYLADVVYFGTINGSKDDWGGGVNRLVVRDWVPCGTKQTQIETKPSQWKSLFVSNTAPFMPLIDTEQPITAAPTVATDGSDYWVYFGTGRFFDTNDKQDNAIQTFYGIREPRSALFNDMNLNLLNTEADPNTCQLTWSQVLNDRLDTSTGGVKQDGTVVPDGHRAKLGLMQVDQIEILSTNLLTQDETLACIGGGTSCLPEELVYTATEAFDIAGIDAGDTKSFNDLVNYITGDYRNCVGTNPGKDGWYRDFHEARERNLGQATLLGGLASFTTYRPFDDPCKDEGLGYLYGVYYLTGTAWVEDVFGTVDVDSNPRNVNPVRMDLGKGLSTTPNIQLGSGIEGSKAFIQTSVGKIVEIPQPNLPEKQVKSGRIKWRDIEQ